MEATVNRSTPIFVTQSFSPPVEEYLRYVQQILKSRQFTNNGPLLRELEDKLRDCLGVKYLQFVTNGTLALQLALRGLGITEGEIVTTPFTYVATTSAILWEHCEPVFVDIDPRSFCIDPERVEAALTPKTRAILAVHVFGVPCDVRALEDLGKRRGIPVVYDAAHAFGVEYLGRSLCAWGDVATCSFHATKLFHTIEGGCVVCHDSEIHDKIDLAKRFGHKGDVHYSLGINAKASELQAAMGLCNLPWLSRIIEDRRRASNYYSEGLRDRIERPRLPEGVNYNYAYYPVVFRDEKDLLNVAAALKEENIHLRRYFYPSLNTLPYLESRQKCPISENVASRIACLPLYYGIETAVLDKIIEIVKGVR